MSHTCQEIGHKTVVCWYDYKVLIRLQQVLLQIQAERKRLEKGKECGAIGAEFYGEMRSVDKEHVFKYWRKIFNFLF